MKNDQPLISVIMPVYNTKEEFLREAIEAVLKQTYINFEFIILNDGSTNNAQDVILSYKDKRIVYVKHENMGVGKTRNRGFELAKGEFIAAVDSDDISLPERFEKQIKFLQENPDVSIVGSWFECFPELKIIKNPADVRFLDVLYGCCVANPTVMFRREDFKKYNLKYTEMKVSHDYALWAQAVIKLKIRNIQEVLIKYRWHGDNISNDLEAVSRDDPTIRKNMLEFLTANEKLQDKIMKLIYATPKTPFIKRVVKKAKKILFNKV